MAEGGDEIQGPRDYEKAVSAAYLRILGNNQGDAATAAGVGERTLARWETCSWWGDILREAEDRWLSGIVAQARKLFGDEMDLSHAFKVLERRVPELAPPSTTSNVNLHQSGTLQVEVTRKVVAVDPKNRVSHHIGTSSGTNGAGRA